MWEAELKDVFWSLLKILAPAPIFGYFYLFLMEDGAKAWKSNSRRKKWFVCSSFFVITAAVIKYWYRIVF